MYKHLIKLIERVNNMKLFSKILVLNIIVLAITLYFFANFVSRNSLKILRETQEGICSQNLTALQNVMSKKNEAIKEILFKIYDDEEIHNYVMGMLNINGDDYIIDKSYERKNLVKKFDTMVSADNTISELVLYNKFSQKSFLYSKDRTFFDQNDELVKKIPQLQENTAQILTVPAHKGGYGNQKSNQYYFGTVNNIIYPSTSIILGRLVIEFSIDDFEEVFRQNGKALKGSVLILTKEGDVVYDSTRTFYGKKYPYFNMVKESSQSVMLDTESIVNVINSERDRFIYIGVIPKSQLYNQFNMLSNSTFIVATILLLLMFSIYFSVTGVISKKINIIIKAMNNSVKSNLNYRIPIKSGNDEFDQIASHFNTMCDNLQEYINKSYAYELQQKIAKIKLLENQINPHFLYNSLEAIRASFDMDDNDQGATMIHSLATIFRESLKAGSVVHIHEELDYCRMYINMFNLRYKNYFQVKFAIEETILDFGIIKLLLQPVLENYFIHGFDHSRTDNILSINGYKQDQDIFIVISDNGNGIDSETLTILKHQLAETSSSAPGSIGLFNINERIKLFFGAQYGLSVDSIPDKETSITLRLPAKTVEEML